MSVPSSTPTLFVECVPFQTLQGGPTLLNNIVLCYRCSSCIADCCPYESSDYCWILRRTPRCDVLIAERTTMDNVTCCKHESIHVLSRARSFTTGRDNWSTDLNRKPALLIDYSKCCHAHRDPCLFNSVNSSHP